MSKLKSSSSDLLGHLQSHPQSVSSNEIESLSNSSSSENISSENSFPQKRPRSNPKSFPPKFYFKSPNEISSLKRSLIQSFIFYRSTIPDLTEIIHSMHLVNFAAGMSISHKETESSDLYVIKKGKAKIEIADTIWEEIGPGGLIGEINLLHDVPHIVEALVVEDCECWVLYGATFDYLINKNAIHTKSRFLGLLKNVFHDLDDERIKRLFKFAKYEVFLPGESIALGSNNSGKCFILYDGVGKYCSGKKGEFCWEIELGEDFLACGLVKCLTLTFDSVTNILGEEYSKVLLKTKYG